MRAAHSQPTVVQHADDSRGENGLPLQNVRIGMAVTIPEADGAEIDRLLQTHDYEHRRHEETADLWDREAAKGVFVRRQEIPGEVNADFAFTDKTALEAVRFRSFVRDCRGIERPFDETE